MKRRKLTALLIIIAVMILQLQVCAAEERNIDYAPKLSFAGTTANCIAYVRAGSGNDEIVAMMRLWDSGTCLRTWRSTGKGSVNLEESYAVSRGKTYRLTLDVTINGRVQPTQSTSKTCN